MRLFLFAIILACGCRSNHNNQIEELYGNKKELLETFSGKSIFRSRGQNLILLYTHNNGKTNKYAFEITDSAFLPLKDSISYIPEMIFTSKGNISVSNKTELIPIVKSFLNKMDEYGIRDISGELADIGIELQFFLKESKGSLIYISSQEKLNTKFWQNYIHSLRKLDNNWYYRN